MRRISGCIIQLFFCTERFPETLIERAWNGSTCLSHPFIYFLPDLLFNKIIGGKILAGHLLWNCKCFSFTKEDAIYKNLTGELLILWQGIKIFFFCLKHGQQRKEKVYHLYSWVVGSCSVDKTVGGKSILSSPRKEFIAMVYHGGNVMSTIIQCFPPKVAYCRRWYL